MKWVLLIGLCLGAVVVGLFAALFGGVLALLLLVPILVLLFVFKDYRIGVICLAFLLPWSASPLLPQAQGLNVINYLVASSLLSFGLQAVFSRRLDLTLNILGRHAIRWQRGLSFVWLPMPRGWRASTFARLAEAAGVLVRTADEYALTDGRAPNAIRVALAGAIPEADFTAALTTLARLLDSPPDDLAV